jgi:murein DD-endopeptidase MepM/ murein hydrolase activator NlpD
VVESGEVIGLSGNTGNSSAPHLHFEIRRRGQVVDPLTLVKEGT